MVNTSKDIVILVLGPTGSGKSTFVNTVIGEERMEVGYGTTSCTSVPTPVYVDPIPLRPNLKGYRLVLLDTPGFDDTYVDDVQILNRIAEWLNWSRHEGALIGGVLYLHDMSNKRLTSTARQNLETFARICGEDTMKKTVLVTTNWDLDATNPSYDQRESELTAKYWKPIIQKGATVKRFCRNPESAWEIISSLLDRADFQDPLQLQKQLVDHQIPFAETKVGRHAIGVTEKKKEGRKKQKEMMARLCMIQ